MASVVSSSPSRKGFGRFSGGKRRDRVEVNKDPMSLSEKAFVSTANPPLKSCLSSNNLSSMNTGSSDKMMRRNVSFHQIEIREYERTLGDNPCVSSGPPIALGWQYDPSHTVLNVEEYEAERPTRRTRSQFVMSHDARTATLKKEWGVTGQEMMKTIKDVNITKRQRRATKKTPRSADKRHELLEKARRKAKRLVSSTPSTEEEIEQLWRDAQTYEYSTKKNEDMRRTMSLNDLENAAQVVDSLETATNSCMKTAADCSVTQSCNDLRLLSLEECQEEEDDSNLIPNHDQSLDTSDDWFIKDDDGDEDEWGFGLDEE